MTEFARDRIFNARDEWKAAERAYNDELSRYASSGWMADGPLVPPEKALDRAGYAELMRLKKAAEDAHRAFEETVRNITGR